MEFGSGAFFLVLNTQIELFFLGLVPFKIVLNSFETCGQARAT